jgi:hypothetical protein
MNKYRVRVSDEFEEDIDADKVLITHSGDLKFTNKQSSLLAAYAAGHWLEVSVLEDEPTAEQTGATALDAMEN